MNIADQPPRNVQFLLDPESVSYDGTTETEGETEYCMSFSINAVVEGEVITSQHYDCYYHATPRTKFDFDVVSDADLRGMSEDEIEGALSYCLSRAEYALFTCDIEDALYQQACATIEKEVQAAIDEKCQAEADAEAEAESRADAILQHTETLTEAVRYLLDRLGITYAPRSVFGVASWDYIHAAGIEIRISDHPQPANGGLNMGTGKRYGRSDISLIVGEDGIVKVDRCDADRVEESAGEHPGFVNLIGALYEIDNAHVEDCREFIDAELARSLQTITHLGPR